MYVYGVYGIIKLVLQLKQQQSRTQQRKQRKASPQTTLTARRGAFRRDDVQRMIAQHNFGIHSNLLWFHLTVIIASTLRTRLQDGQFKVAWVQAKVGQQYAVAVGDQVVVEVPQDYFVCKRERDR